MWGRQSYRHGDLDFEANAKDGIAVDWPIRYKDIEKWYSYAETFAGISGTRNGIESLPDGQYMPPIALNCAEEMLSGKLAKSFGGKRHLIPGRAANITMPHHGRGACQSRNACSSGCIYGAYFSTQSSTLPAAVATGNLTMKTFQIVSEIRAWSIA